MAGRWSEWTGPAPCDSVVRDRLTSTPENTPRNTSARPTSHRGGGDLSDVLEMDFTPAERALFFLQVGDVLLTEASGSAIHVGRAALWHGELAECCFQNTIIRFRPHAVIPQYALLVFRHYAASGLFARVARGMGILHLGAGRFAELLLPLAPLDEQKRIVEVVERRLQDFREAKTLLYSALERIEVQRKAVLVTTVARPLPLPIGEEDGNHPPCPGELHRKAENPSGKEVGIKGDSVEDPDHPGQLPSSWKWVTIDQAGEVRLGRQKRPEKDADKLPTPYLRSANITAEGLDLSNVKMMGFTAHERSVFALRDGDVVLTEASGSSSQVARAALWQGQIEDCCYQNHIIRFRPSCVIPKYALLVFHHYAASGVFARIARGIGIQHLGAARFASIQFPLPPIGDQKRIVEAVEKRLEELREAAGHVSSALERFPRMEKGFVRKICG